MGLDGTGDLTIRNDADLDVTGASEIGVNVGSIGTVTVTGLGSTWKSTLELYVGFGGQGTLTIADGGSVENRRGVIGDLSDSTGTVTVTGTNSIWINNEDLIVGDSGAGTLTIADGGRVTSQGGFIGFTSTGVGTVTVTGADSLWENTGSLNVGFFGTGTLTVADGGHVSNTIGFIGNALNSIGTATVTGAGSTWINSGSLFVGNSGTGSLTISDGGRVESSGAIVGSDGIGSATVTGPGSTWNNFGNLSVGLEGTGTLSIADGGSVSNTNGSIGSFAGSIGTVTVTGSGSTWANSRLEVGVSGTGTLTVADGGSVASTEGRIGDQSPGVGTVTVTGAGSTWTNTSILSVGNQGTGTLTVSNGGSVTNGGTLFVGFGGTGTLTVADGGSISSTFGYIGYFGVGTVTVTGTGSTWTDSSSLTVGARGTGTLIIEAGGRVENTTGVIGDDEFPAGVGTVTVTDAGSTWANSSNLTVGDLGTGTLTIANGGLVQVGNGIGTVRIARSQTGFIPQTGTFQFRSTGTLNIGAALGAPAAAPGTLEAGSVIFGTGVGTLNFNHTGTDYTFAPAISGNGAINVAAGTTLLTADSGAFSGSTDITGGKLVVNGTLGGTVSVSGGGILGGSGTVGTTIAQSGGVIAPGNSVGTLTVDGDLTFEPGSIYEVEIDGNTSDLIVVTGTATLNGGTVVVTGNVSAFNYQILTAVGGVTGTFAGVNDSYAFLDALLAYGTNDVTLRMERNNVAFASVAGTPNQKATAGGLDSLSFGNPVYDAIVVLDGPNAQKAFDQLSGEVHASGITALIGNSGKVRSIVSRRFQSVFADRQAATSFPLTSYASWGSAAEQASAGGYSAWGQVFGSWGRTSGDGNAASLRHDEGGFLAGIDAVLAETWSVGAFAGYSRSTFNVRDRNSSGSSDNFHLGFHAGTEIGALRLNAGAVHTWHALDTSRTVAFPGFSETLSASYSARTAQIFGEAGYRFDMGGMAFEPFAGLAYVHTTTSSFSETGGAAALTAAGSTTATTFSTLGLRAFSQFDMGGMQATARAMVGWRHAFGDTVPTTRLNFAGGTGFSVSGAPIAKDAALVEAGLDLAIRENVTFGLSYDGQYSRRTQEHGFNARLRVAF